MSEAKFKVTLEDGVTPGAKKAEVSLAGLFERLTGASSVGTFVGNTFYKIAESLVTIGIEGVKAFGMLTFEIGKAGVNAAAFRESASLALGTITSGDGTKEFEKLKRLAEEMGTPLQETVNSVRELRSKGFGADQAETLFKQLQDLKAVGADAESVQRAVLAMTQIMGAGKLQGDELNQLAEAGVPLTKVYGALAKNLGMTVPEIMKLKEAGKIDAGTALRGIQDALTEMSGGKAPGELGKEFAQNTLTGMAASLRAQGSILGDDLGLGMTEGLAEFRPLLKDFLAFLKTDDAKAVVYGIGAAFGYLVGQLAALIQSDAMGYLITGFEWLAEGIDMIGGPTTILYGLAGVLGILGVAMTPIMVGLGLIGVAIGAAVAAIGLLIAAFQKLYEYSGIKLLIDLFSGGGSLLGNALVQGLLAGLNSGQGLIIQTMTQLANTAIATAKSVLGIASPSKVFAEIGGYMGEGMAGGLDGTTATIEGSAAGVAQGAIASAAGGTTNNLAATAGGVTVNISMGGGGAMPGDTAAVGKSIEQAVARALNGVLGGLAAEAV